MLRFKQMLLGGALGRAAHILRDKVDLMRCPAEQVPALLNDQMAFQITTRLCQSGRTFIDIGAHIGSVIAKVQYHVPGVQIIAVEADPEKAEQLRRKFPGVTVHACALSESTGEVPFFVDKLNPGNSSLADNGGEKIIVSARILDDLDLPDIDVVKIDVEGAELGVLIGGDKLINRCRPTIMFESAPEEVLGYTKRAIYQWLTERRFLLFVPNRLAHFAPALGMEAFVDSHHYPRRTTNYFAVPAERLEEVRTAIPKLSLGSFLTPLVTPPSQATRPGLPASG